MIRLSYERAHKVLCLTFSGIFTTDDLDLVDPTLVRFLGGTGVDARQLRGIFDMTDVEALAVPQPRFVERAGKPAIGEMERIVVAPPWAGAEFGQSYRQGRSLWPHKQPTIVSSLAEAHMLLDIDEACFEPVN